MRVCKGCGYWINFDPLLNAWVDEDDDDSCYDENLNLIGDHKPLYNYWDNADES
jgi:hypothetical protein